MERFGGSCFLHWSFSLIAISLKHEVMGCRCLAFVYNVKYEGAVDSGSLEVQNQPGKICLARRALTILSFGGRVKTIAAAICHPILEGLLYTPEKQNTSLL